MDQPSNASFANSQAPGSLDTFFQTLYETADRAAFSNHVQLLDQQYNST